MGLGYVDSVIVYNEYINQTSQTQFFLGTRLDNVRVELTQGENVMKSGNEDADDCILKIDKKRTSKPYIAPEVWNDLPTEEMEKYYTLNKKNNDFFVIVKKEDLGIDVDLPVGAIDGESDAYGGNFYEWVNYKYGYTYAIKHISSYGNIPYFAVGGK